MNESEHPGEHSAPFTGYSDRGATQAMAPVFRALRERGVSDYDARERLAVMEPFQERPDLIEALKAVAEEQVRDE